MLNDARKQNKIAKFMLNTVTSLTISKKIVLDLYLLQTCFHRCNMAL
jgi:hypothetical protein